MVENGIIPIENEGLEGVWETGNPHGWRHHICCCDWTSDDLMPVLIYKKKKKKKKDNSCLTFQLFILRIERKKRFDFLFMCCCCIISGRESFLLWLLLSCCWWLWRVHSTDAPGIVLSRSRRPLSLIFFAQPAALLLICRWLYSNATSAYRPIRSYNILHF